jgi:hypothetical protein
VIIVVVVNMLITIIVVASTTCLIKFANLISKQLNLAKLVSYWS